MTNKKDSRLDAADALTFGGLAIAAAGVALQFSPWWACICVGLAVALIGLFLR